MITDDTKRELHSKARTTIVTLLKSEGTGEKYELNPHRPGDLAVAALGKERAEELRSRTWSIVNELLSAQRSGLQQVASVRSSADEAEAGFRAERSINSLGVLQGSGSRLDVYAAQFHLLVTMAIDALTDESIALQEALATGDVPAIEAAAATLRGERERESKRRQKEACEAQALRTERDALRCVQESYGRGRAYSKSRCEKSGRFLVQLSDGTDRRYCGTHLKSAVYGGIQVGTTLMIGGKSVGVTGIVDTKE